MNDPVHSSTSSAGQFASLAAAGLTSISPASGPAAGGNTVVLTGTGFVGITGLRFGTAPAAFTVNSSTQITAVAPAGIGTVNVTVRTVSGTSNPLAYTYLAAPTLISVVPNSGPSAGGNTVLLTGTGFTGATTVRSFTVVSDTHITAVTPAGTGTVNVVATTTGGPSNTLPYTYVPAPTLTSITPNTGPETGANTVILTGTNLTTTTAVSFGATPPSSFTVVSDTQISVTVPPGVGTVGVTATTTGGTSNTVLYTYVPTPILTSITPNTGPATGGNTVILTGTHLSGATAVNFGANTAVSFTVVSDTSITAVVPAGTAGPVLVTATTAGGTSNPVSYTYVAAPTLISVVPNSGPVAGGNSVVLTGTGFTGATAVNFGATPATSFTVVSATQITAVVPAGTAGTVAVTVSAIGGTSNGALYTYLSAPTLTSLSPNQGPTSGGIRSPSPARDSPARPRSDSA